MDNDKKKLPNDSELSIKDLVNLLLKWLRLLKKNILPILVCSILSAVCAYYYSKTIQTKFKAELRFIVKSEGSASGLGGLLGGIGSAFGGGAIGSPLERTIEIASSDRIIGNALLSEVRIGSKKEILANSLIRINKLNETWKNDSLLKDLQFVEDDKEIENMSFPKRKAIKTLQSILIPKSGEGIISKSFDKKSGVVTLAASHSNEEFAIVLTKEVFNKLREFYVDQMTTSASNNVIILQKKVDSIKFELAKVQSTYARATDQSFGLLFQEDKVVLKKLAVREQMLISMYAEALKNLETFKFMNDSAIPSLTVIDMPYSPLKRIEANKVFYTAGAFLVGGILAFLFFAIRVGYRN